MEIPYVVKLREDTNLYNAKVGKLLFPSKKRKKGR